MANQYETVLSMVTLPIGIRWTSRRQTPSQKAVHPSAPYVKASQELSGIVEVEVAEEEALLVKEEAEDVPWRVFRKLSTHPSYKRQQCPHL